MQSLGWKRIRSSTMATSRIGVLEMNLVVKPSMTLVCGITAGVHGSAGVLLCLDTCLLFLSRALERILIFPWMC